MRSSRSRTVELEALYRSRFGHFVNVARGITGDTDQAREAVQEAFANALRTQSAFRGDGSLEAWLWRSVVNAALKSLRPRLHEVGSEAPESEAVPVRVAELAPLVGALPERQSIVVFLRYYADLDYRSIAEALGVEVGTVSATLASAHRSIRRALSEVRADA